MGSGNFNTTYEQEIKTFRTFFARFWLAVFFVMLLVFPFLFPAKHYYVFVINLTGIAVIGGIGLNLLTGFTGQLSLGQHAFLAIGAYGAAILGSKLHLPFWMTIPLVGCITAFAGLIIGLPALRLKGLYLAMATLAFAFIVDHFVAHSAITGASAGIAVPRIRLGDTILRSDRAFYFLIIGVAILLTILAKNLTRSRVGRAFVAIRDYDLAANIIGVNLTKYKLYSFMISSFYVGVAGALYAYYMGFIAPDHFTLGVTIEYIAIIIVGGLGSILGSIYGAVVITLLPEILRMGTDLLREPYPLLSEYFGDLKTVAYGLVIVVFLVFEPEGFSGRWVKIKSYWRLWPFHN